MAIELEFINFIVPIQVIKAKYPGGWDACLSDHANLIGGRVWYDDHLFRDGAMNTLDIDVLIERWQENGLEPFEIVDGQQSWKDVCVVEYFFGWVNIPCPWLKMAPNSQSAHLSGTEPGVLIGRHDFIKVRGRNKQP